MNEFVFGFCGCIKLCNKKILVKRIATENLDSLLSKFEVKSRSDFKISGKSRFKIYKNILCTIKIMKMKFYDDDRMTDFIAKYSYNIFNGSNFSHPKKCHNYHH